NTTRDEYRGTVDKSVLFLEGRYDALARDTKKEMQQASDALAFERAATLRDRLVAIERTLDRQEVHAYKGDDCDVHAAPVAPDDALAERNARDARGQERVRWLAERGKTDTALRELAEALGLEGSPKRIECYDVSHVQGTSVVSSMVVFEDGRPAKHAYRRFRA